MKVGWRERTLSEVLEIQNGYAFNSKQFVSDAGMPLIRIRDLKGGITTETNFDGAFDERYRVRAGDFLIGMDGEFGCYEWRGPDALLNQRVCRLANFSPDIDSRYLFHGINSHLKAIEDVTGFTTVKHLSSKQITSIEFLFPPLEEQRRIVAVLDEAFAAIATATANAEKNLANARELFSSTIEEVLEKAVGRRTMTLLEAADEACSLSYGIVQPGEEQAGGLPIVRPTDLQQKCIGLSSLKRIDASLASSYQRTTLKGDDLLLCVRGTTGTLSIATPELAGANVTRGIVPIRFNPAILSQELGYFLLLSASAQKQIKAATYGAALMQINIRDLKKLKLRVPPLASQGALADRLNAAQADVEQLQTNFSAKLDALTALKQALLHRAFTGKLTAAVPQATNESCKTPAFTGQVIAFAYRRHLVLGTENTFGRVKAQKALHLCESVGKVDLGRNPIKDAAGPNDFQHMLAAEDWAKANQFFEFVPRSMGSGYTFKKLARFETVVAEGIATLKPVQGQLEKVIALIAPMKSEQAELLATVHAAWNNLILDGAEPTEEAIIYEARENWHASKLKFAENKFREAIATIRTKGIIPDGTAKRVGGQVRLL